MRSCAWVGFIPFSLAGAGLLLCSAAIPLLQLRDKPKPAAEPSSPAPKPLKSERSHFEKYKILGITVAEVDRWDNESHPAPPPPTPPKPPAPPPKPPLDLGEMQGWNLVPLIEVPPQRTTCQRTPGATFSAFDVEELEAQVRIVPAYSDGKAIGFKLFAIREDSLYAAIGLRDGDVMESLNGYPMDSPDHALEAIERTTRAPRIYVGVEREHRRMVVSFTPCT